MSELSTEVENLKFRYRKVFLEIGDVLSKAIENKPSEDARAFLNQTLKQAWEQWLRLLQSRNNFSCLGCASCCKLACSEFSPQELAQKAQNNDNFARQFLSVFVPYESEEDAQKIYPEYFELLKEKASGEKVYFYHCPKVTENNRCPDYENRPQICMDFPDNPLGFLPKRCGFLGWKKDVEDEALKIQAQIEIASFYKEKI